MVLLDINENAGALSSTQAFELLTTLRNNPTDLCVGLLGYDPWSMQRTILDALAIPQNRVAVKAAHSVGKTNMAAMATFWRVLTGGIVISTAPTWSQVKNVLWKEIHSTYDKYKDKLGGDMFTTEWRIDPNCYAIGLSTNEGVRFQGHHGDILIIIDEAPGVKADIWEAIEGIRAGGNVNILALGNPTTVGNQFHNAFLQTGGEVGWDLYSIPAFATPNFDNFPDIKSIKDASLKERMDVPRPYLTRPQWVLEKFYEWGEDSPMYQSRIMAQFPEHSEFSLISMAWVMQAANRELPEPKTPNIDVGIDVAGAGEDETVMYWRNGSTVLGFEAWSGPDPREECLQKLGEIRDSIGSSGKMRVKVDSAGVGHYFAQDVKLAGFDMIPVNVGVSPIERPLKKIKGYGATIEEQSKEIRYANLKAQLYWQLRDTFRLGQIAGLDDEMTQGQVSTIQYLTTPQGKIMIEKKEDLQKRGLKSPDRAEALMLCYADLDESFAKDKIYRPVIVLKGTSGGWGFGTGQLDPGDILGSTKSSHSRR